MPTRSNDSPSSQAFERLTYYLAAATLVAALVFGGQASPGSPGDLVVQWLALPLLAVGLIRLRWAELDRSAKFALWILVAALLLLLLQLVPLPLEFWRQLPGRSALMVQLESAGVTSFPTSTSLDRHATEGMLWSLIPPAAVLIATLNLPWRRLRGLILVLLGFAALNVVLVRAQIVPEAIGFFANNNHFAALLYMCIPLAFVWVWVARDEQKRHEASRVTLSIRYFVLAVIIMGVFLSQSRAGLALGMLASIASLMVILRSRTPSLSSMRALTVTFGVAALVGLQYGLFAILRRFEISAADDARWLIAKNTLELAKSYSPVGSGFGTFVNAYQRIETTDNITQPFINHAHNDWLELWLEGGWPALVLMALFVAGGVYTIWQVWRRRLASSPHLLFVKAAIIGIVLLLVHELVDYNLRSTAIMVTFALLVGFVVKAQETSMGRSRSSRPSSA